MAYNAVEMADWQISEEAEKNMPLPEEWIEKLGLKKKSFSQWGVWPSSTSLRSSIV